MLLGDQRKKKIHFLVALLLFILLGYFCGSHSKMDKEVAKVRFGDTVLRIGEEGKH